MMTRDIVALEKSENGGKYGSKIVAIMRKMKQVVKENSKAKIIMFIQFKTSEYDSHNPFGSQNYSHPI